MTHVDKSRLYIFVLLWRIVAFSLQQTVLFFASVLLTANVLNVGWNRASDL